MKASTNKLSILSRRSLSLVQIFLALLLSSCNSIEALLDFEGNPTSTKVSEDNPFASVEFPLESCSDPLPKDETAYPIELYTVFVVVVDNNPFEDIQEKYCKTLSSSSKLDSDGGESFVIQVASFIGRDRAEQFRDILTSHFNTIKISEPTIITEEDFSEPSDISIFSKLDDSPPYSHAETIGKAALLAPNQINTLLEYARKTGLKFVLPTYIPQGFKLVKFDIKQYGLYYYLAYQNSNKSCFTFTRSFEGPVGGIPTFATTVNANSPALGTVPIAVVSSEKMNNKVNSVRFHREFERRDFGDFVFHSPGYRFEDDSCQAMNFVEAVKVAESFQFLQEHKP